MSTMLELQPMAPTAVTARRVGSWRDKIRAEYELSQARLRVALADDELEEYL